ncbi:hypothetical protein FB566_3016 [Stackebrandtia endophytica]|uniref:DUF3558 domain-containing protein n=1 Tax=Stackebrandtia endophytica TaxID=1496996 RepID=A0A543AY08_9ACTN|nr:hypothetical protein [Stackebrandtia endophytica]TQL77457.1 hypothetical protein FB566_3016 [Stackebrandtia endophytica]
MRTKSSPRIAVILLSVAIGVGLASCGTAEPEAQGTPTPTPEATGFGGYQYIDGLCDALDWDLSDLSEFEPSVTNDQDSYGENRGPSQVICRADYQDLTLVYQTKIAVTEEQSEELLNINWTASGKNCGSDVSGDYPEWDEAYLGFNEDVAQWDRTMCLRIRDENVAVVVFIGHGKIKPDPVAVDDWQSNTAAAAEDLANQTRELLRR